MQNVLIRLEDDVKKWWEDQASTEDRSLNKTIARFLRAEFQRQQHSQTGAKTARALPVPNDKRKDS